MFSPSLEIDLIFSLFQLLACGLTFIAVCIALWQKHNPIVHAPSFRFLGGVFFLLSGHFLLKTLDIYLEMTRPEAGVHVSQLHLAVNAAEVMAYLCLIPSYRPGLLRLPALLAPAIALTWPPGWGAAPLNFFLLAVVVLLHLGRNRREDWFAISPVIAALLSTGCRLLHAGGLGQQPFDAYMWSAARILMLVSLALFALLVEQRSQSLYMQIFVRLNLIFIMAAGLLVAAVADGERQQWTELETKHLESLSEYLRGHTLYFHQRGQSPVEILSNETIIEKVVSEFGRIVELRAIRVLFLGQQMEITIAKDGTIEHVVRPEARSGLTPSPAVRFSAGERVATFLTLPIYYNRRQIGTVEIDETLKTIDAAFGRQVGRIFLTFTLLVLVSGMLIVLTVQDADRTIRRQYKELDRTNLQLLQAAKLASVGELAGGVAHELNNPAGIILARADYMQSILPASNASAELIEDLKVVRRQARRISGIVQDLLTFSRPSPLQIRSVDLNDVVNRSLSLIAPRYRSSGILLSPAMQAALPPIQADADRLEQVFVNILNNAIDAMPRGGRLTVATGVADAQTVFAKISDTGTGIAAEHLARLFDPFFSTKSPGKGTGLGLAISYGIVRDHGGEIQVESTLGRGAVLTVLLPITGDPHAVQTNSRR